MDRTNPCEGLDVGSIPTESTRTKNRAYRLIFCLSSQASKSLCLRVGIEARLSRAWSVLANKRANRDTGRVTTDFLVGGQWILILIKLSLNFRVK